MSNEEIKKAIIEAKTYLGIELGSTRIKSVLIGEDYNVIASGAHNWENRLENGIWTYSLDEVWSGIQSSFKDLNNQVIDNFGVNLENISSIGISAMMHGYLVFDSDDNQLVPFRTWRNTMTEQSAEKLTDAFQFNIPQRWSIAHLYEAILKKEPHIDEISFMTTLAGYVHWKLSGEQVLGVGEASGVFPIDSTTNDYNAGFVDKFDALIAGENLSWRLQEILPKVMVAGVEAGTLTQSGARLIDPSGTLQAGSILCPPEGDAGTGMVATNSITKRTGNVSAGTSIFAMLVLEKELSKLHREIDMVTTPAGRPVAMVHCNNCSSDIDAWINLFGEVLGLFGESTDKTEIYSKLYNKALEADKDGGGLLAYNYYSGEHITGFEQGRPLLVRTPESRFNLANLMRTLLYSTVSTLKIGMDILTKEENVHIDQILGHGGLFKTDFVAQSIMAGALGVPVVVMQSAGEGGAWGIALLAAFMQKRSADETLESFLENRVFADNVGTKVEPDIADTKGFEQFIERYKDGVAIERSAVENLQ